MGISRALACEAAWTCLTRPGCTVLLVSRSLAAARNLLCYVSRSIGPNIQCGRLAAPSKRNSTSLEWEDRESRVVSLSASIDAARSYSATDVYLDEAAYLPWAEEIYQSLAPTVSQGGRMTIVSTPRGRGNLFHRLWEEAAARPEAWSLHRVHWSQRPEYTAEWAEQERTRHTSRSWAEEYELSFEDSGSSVFQEAALQAMLVGSPSDAAPPLFAGVDLARASDYTAIAVLDNRGQLVQLERFNQAAWSIQIERVVNILEGWTGCKVLCDATGAGDPVTALIRQRAAAHRPPRFSVEPFLYTTDSRTALLEELVLAVEGRQIHLSGRCTAESMLLAEMRAYQWEHTPSGRARPDHPSGGHDDCIQALALAWKGLHSHRSRTPRCAPALTAVSSAATGRW